MTPAPDAPVVVSADATLVEPVLAAAAAAGVEVFVTTDPADAAGRWSTARAVLVGLDRVRPVAELLLPRRAGVVVVGPDDAGVVLPAWSQPLAATVLALPSGTRWLSGLLLGGTGPVSGRGTVLVVVGGSGGVGASTLAAGLALLAEEPGLLVDLDPLGPGLDLLLGIEDEPGWRWDRLASADGHLPDLARQLPHAGPVPVLAMPRAQREPPTPAALTAVLGAASNSHGLVIVDAGRALHESAREALRHAHRVVLVAGNSVCGLAAAGQVATVLTSAGQLELVLRRQVRGVDAARVSEVLGLPVLGTLPDDPRLAAGAERGEAPDQAGRRVWRNAVADLADRLTTVERLP